MHFITTLPLHHLLLSCLTPLIRSAPKSPIHHEPAPPSPPKQHNVITVPEKGHVWRMGMSAGENAVAHALMQIGAVPRVGNSSEEAGLY